MAKATKLWFGNDSTGRSVEVAVSVDGEYYSRAYEYNGYGMSWSKWESHEPDFAISTENAYSGKVTHHPERPVMCYGFTRLTQYIDNPRVRLPRS